MALDARMEMRIHVDRGYHEGAMNPAQGSFQLIRHLARVIDEKVEKSENRVLAAIEGRGCGVALRHQDSGERRGRRIRLGGVEGSLYGRGPFCVHSGGFAEVRENGYRKCLIWVVRFDLQ